jgi:hypothetical protein
MYIRSGLALFEVIPQVCCPSSGSKINYSTTTKTLPFSPLFPLSKRVRQEVSG